MNFRDFLVKSDVKASIVNEHYDKTLEKMISDFCNKNNFKPFGSIIEPCPTIVCKDQSSKQPRYVSYWARLDSKDDVPLIKSIEICICERDDNDSFYEDFKITSYIDTDIPENKLDEQAKCTIHIVPGTVMFYEDFEKMPKIIEQLKSIKDFIESKKYKDFIE